MPVGCNLSPRDTAIPSNHRPNEFSGAISPGFNEISLAETGVEKSCRGIDFIMLIRFVVIFL